MKGPGNRIDLDVRRLWKCPRCGDERKATGTVSTKNCLRPECAGAGMKLVEPLRKPVLRYTPPAHVPIPDDPEPAARGNGGGENPSRPSRKQRRDTPANGPVAESGIEPVSEAATVAAGEAVNTVSDSGSVTPAVPTESVGEMPASPVADVAAPSTDPVREAETVPEIVASQPINEIASEIVSAPASGPDAAPA
jgi:hypothetical protein